MRFKASNEMNPAPMNRAFTKPSKDKVEPFRAAEIRKKRWLIATSATGLLGATTLAIILSLTPEPRNQHLVTRPLTETGQAKTNLPKPASGQNQIAAAPHKTPNPVSGSGKQAMLKIAPNRINIKKTITRPATGKDETAITGTEKLAAKTQPRKALPVPAAHNPPNHGDLMAALKKTNRETSTTRRMTPAPDKANPLAKATIAPKTAPKTNDSNEEIRLIVGKGDTLYGLLTDKGISPLDATNIIRELRPVFSPKNLKKGHILAMTLRRDPATGITRPQSMEIKTKKANRYAVKLNAKGKYERIGKPTRLANIASPLSSARPKKTPRYNRARAQIQSSFYQSALAQNLPPGIVNKMTGILSYDVDFQREVNRGDTFEVLYSGQQSKDKGVLYAELVTNRKKHAFYRFKTPDGMVNYYNKNGESAQKTFMRTPVSSARITSRFGRRKHPILGYTKMHTGIDFGVARGTPIYAAASGTVQKAGWAGGYGKYVRIRHSKKLSTAYAHMSRIARGIRPGKKISQGQIIGYVGSTGRSTGPHLHYEIRVSGKPVNPMRYKLANKTRKLNRKWLALFKKEKSRIDRLRKQIPIATNVASIGN